MSLVVPPALLLAVLLALLGTQLAYVAAPRRPRYLAKLGVSLLAFLLGEGIAALGVAADLALGDLHIVHDLLFLLLGQWVASRWVAGRSR